jgi:Pyruvate/2-oxoacid:ferredoxin oxidoreductase delta subunit
MQKLLEESELIAASNCACREKVHGCNAPLAVCFSINGRAKTLIDKGLAKKVTVEEALDALRRTHEAGLVHITLTIKGRNQPEVICSCCSCCCHSLSGLIRFGMSDAVVESKYVASYNSATCINCGKCVSRCQFKANNLENGKVKFDQIRCFGCGVCVSTCPTNSISLIPRQRNRETQ